MDFATPSAYMVQSWRSLKYSPPPSSERVDYRFYSVSSRKPGELVRDPLCEGLVLPEKRKTFIFYLAVKGQGVGLIRVPLVWCFIFVYQRLNTNEVGAHGWSTITSQRLSIQDWKVSMKQLGRSGPSVGWKNGWLRISLQKRESHSCDSGAAMLKEGSRTNDPFEDGSR